MDNPKILIGTPTYSGKFYCLSEWVENIKKINYPNFDVLLVDNSKDDEYKKRIESLGINCVKSPHYEGNPVKSLCEARKVFFDKALEGGYDYAFSIEQDLFPPADIIQKLLKSDKKIIGTTYLVGQLMDEKIRRKKDWLTSFADLEKEIILPDGNKAMYWMTLSEIKNRGVFRVKSCAFGCTLIARDVLEKIKPRVIEGLRRFDDYYFFEDCFKEGIEVYGDSDILVDHYPSLGGGSGWITL
ncbi:MAG: hypothetical protein WC705_03100 [Candidatus Paceibacterota bacterium]|jgi:glycosyltransferase involved in cell wall biosynthesis